MEGIGAPSPPPSLTFYLVLYPNPLLRPELARGPAAACGRSELDLKFQSISPRGPLVSDP